jgi:hypothetical protein
MLQGLKTSVAVLLGLIIGVAAALPLAWHGTRKGADSLVQSVGNAVAHVEHRQQAMADQALRLQPLLRAHGAPVEPDLFDAVQDERSRLAGDASLTGKLRQVQALEEALLRIEKRWQQAGSDDARLRSSFAYGEFGRVWEKQKRLLVREQMRVEDSVEEVNRILTRWPASTLLRYKTFGGLLRGIFGDVLGNVSFLMRLSLDWAGYAMRKAAALVGQQDPPEPPQWERPKAKVEAAYLDPLRPPVFLAYAPLPEDQVDELQFTQEPGLDYSDVQLDADPAVLENRHAPKPYTMPQPTVQKTVDYRGAR